MHTSDNMATMAKMRRADEDARMAILLLTPKTQEQAIGSTTLLTLAEQSGIVLSASAVTRMMWRLEELGEITLTNDRRMYRPEKTQDVCDETTVTWPQRVTIYVHSDKESNTYLAENELWRGMKLSREFLRNFSYTAYEVALEYEVYGDGTSKLIGISKENDD